jgi:hypothetical protein
MNKEQFGELFLKEPVPLQDQQEFRWLVEKVEAIKPTVVAEIGVDKGGSLKFWLELVSKESLVIGIDPNAQFPSEMPKDFKGEIVLIRGCSNEKWVLDCFGSALGGKQVDFLYIDGAHDEVVFEDYKNYSPFVRSEGIIAFHDCGETSKSYALYHKVPFSETSEKWERGGAPQVRRCFLSIKGKEKELLQFDHGTGVVVV